jgi:nitrous oxidase accessory protein
LNRPDGDSGLFAGVRGRCLLTFPLWLSFAAAAFTGAKDFAEAAASNDSATAIALQSPSLDRPTLDSLPLQSVPANNLPLINHADGHQVLAAGVHRGNFIIDYPGTIECDPNAVIDAGGKGHALHIKAAGVTLRGCRIRNWGSNLTTLDSGIFVKREAHGVYLQGNHLAGPGIGIWLDATPDAVVIANRIEGDPGLRSQDRGNGIHLFNVSGALVADNEVWNTRDGIYIETANRNELRGNFLHDLRYGIHYMYSQHNTLTGNRTTRTRTGYALMQSHHLEVIGNQSEDDENYGILLNYITYSTLEGNRVSGVRQGSGADGGMIAGADGKALFVYNSVFNTIRHNHFASSNLGIHLTAGSENNQITDNTFDRNQQQVKYVATRRQEWSHEGRGNYWSDYLGWDRNNDRVGDIPYEPNDNVDRLLWTYPQARLLMHSPAIEVLRWVQQAFPVIRSPGVKDSAPLMQIPPCPLMQGSSCQ